MGSIAAGFGTMIAAVPKASYAIGKKKYLAGIDTETSSLRSSKSSDSLHKPTPSDATSMLKKAKSDTPSTLKKSKSDQSSASLPHVHREDSMEYRKMKRELGQQGFGRVLKGLVQGIWLAVWLN
jgi:hypothetical protein